MLIKVYQGNIVCQPHEQQVCSACNMNWTQHNEIAHALERIPKINHNNRAHILQLKDKGNECYKANQFNEAIDFYTQALESLWSCHPLNSDPIFINKSKEELLVPILSNRSATYVMTKQFVEALVDAEIVIKLKKNWTKGWFRKGKALMGLKRYEEAKKAYQMGLLYEANNQELLSALKQTENDNRECL